MKEIIIQAYDTWSWVHFQGGMLMVCFLFFILNCKIRYSVLFAPIPTVLKEILDTIFVRLNFEFAFKIGFDRSGGDYLDIVFAILGSLFCLLILIITKKVRIKRWSHYLKVDK